MFVQLAEKARAWRPRFRLRTAFALFLFAALVAGWVRDRRLLDQARQVESISFEIYSDREAFEQRLFGIALEEIDFDDVPTTSSGVVEIAPTRYDARGITITGGSGQYVSRTFGLPADFQSDVQKNLYAPGPVGQNPGANRTNVTFTNKDGPGLVCAFGLNFLDVDFRNQGPSSLTLYDRSGRWLITHDTIQGPHRAAVFRGIVAVDSTGTPVPVIARVRLTNGSGWPGRDVLECVALDDFVFATPQPYPK